MKMLNQIKPKYLYLLFSNKPKQLSNTHLKTKSTSINDTSKTEEKSTELEASQDFYIETLDYENKNNGNIFQDIKKNELLNTPKLKNEDKYERIKNLRAYQTMNNKLIINIINRNRDIRRTIIDKTDCSDDNFTYSSEGVWNNNFEKRTSVDEEELDNNKIGDLINYVMKTNFEDLPKLNNMNINKMSSKEYKKYIIDVLKFLQLNIEIKFRNKNKAKDNKKNESIKDINENLENTFEFENKNIDKYFLEKQEQKRIIFGNQKKYSEKEIDEIVEYLNQESRIDFRNVKENDPEIIDKYIPQTMKDRKKFKEIIDLKTEIILI